MNRLTLAMTAALLAANKNPSGVLGIRTEGKCIIDMMLDLVELGYFVSEINCKTGCLVFFKITPAGRWAVEEMEGNDGNRI